MAAAPGPESDTPKNPLAVRIAAIGILIVLACVAATVAFGINPTSMIPGHCIVGLTGAAVSLEVEGPGADSACSNLERQVTDGGTWYRYAGDTTPGGAVMCQVKGQGRTYTVRDQGLLNVYGSSLCKWVVDNQATL